MADPEEGVNNALALEAVVQSQLALQALSPFPSTDMMLQSSSQTINTELDRKQQATEDTMDGDDEDSGESNEETESDTRKRRKVKTGKRKLDRSKLRKGKWTVEEEEYTSRIIHYFGIGLLTLPEGATLRSYLADKLNCDPMRITKKYAGASCLGRRVYQFQNRVNPTVGDIQVAKAELDHLEQRFRAKAAGETGGGLLPSVVTTSQALVGPSLVAPTIMSAAAPSNQAENPLQTLLLSLAQAQSAAAPAQVMPLAAEIPQLQQYQQPFQMQSMAPMPMPVQPMQSIMPPQLLGNNQLVQLLLATVLQAQNSVASSNSSTGNAYLPPSAPQSSLQLQQNSGNTGLSASGWDLQQNVSNLASLGLLYSQLAAVQPQPAKPPQVQSSSPSSVPSSAPPPPQNTSSDFAASQQQRMQDTILQISQAQQLQYQIQQHQNKLQIQLAEMNDGQRSSPQTLSPPPGFLAPIPPLSAASKPVTLVQPDASAAASPPKQRKQGQKRKSPTTTIVVGQKELKEAYERHIRSQQDSSNGSGDTVPAAAQTTVQQEPRTEEDKAAGNALFGFLLSLRQSYEDALRSGNDSSHSWRQPARVSDDSNADSGETNQPESSVEDSDWNSDKKTDPSSSEDSDKEERSSAKKAKVSSHDSVQQHSRVKHDDTRRHYGYSKHGDINRPGAHRNKGDTSRQGAYTKSSDSSTN